jgi:hypothetical protein
MSGNTGRAVRISQNELADASLPHTLVSRQPFSASVKILTRLSRHRLLSTIMQPSSMQTGLETGCAMNRKLNQSATA